MANELAKAALSKKRIKNKFTSGLEKSFKKSVKVKVKPKGVRK